MEEITKEQFESAKSLIRDYKRQEKKKLEKKNFIDISKTWKEVIKEYDLKEGDKYRVKMIQLDTRDYYNPPEDSWGVISYITDKHVEINGVRWLKLNWKVTIIEVYKKNN